MISAFARSYFRYLFNLDNKKLLKILHDPKLWNKSNSSLNQNFYFLQRKSSYKLLLFSKERFFLILKDQYIIHVRHIAIWWKKQTLSKNFIFTINSSTLPSKIKAAYLICPSRNYINYHLHFFKCQCHSHNKTSYRRFLTCVHFAELIHDK